MKKDEHGYYIVKYKGIIFYRKTLEGLDKVVGQHKIFLQYIAEGREEEYYEKYPLRATI